MNKRGYKKHPHFEVGLFNDRLFIYFALMHNVPDKAKLAQHLIDYQSIFDALDSSYVYALDHYDKEANSLDTLNNQALAYFCKTKKADFLIGKQLTKQETIRMTNSDFDRFVLDTFTALLPLYFETTLAQMK